MNKLILAAFFLLFSSHGFCAGKYKVEGKVVDSLTKEPIEGAVIQVKEGKIYAVSDKEGSFALETERDKINIISGIGGYKNYQKLLFLPCPPLVIELELAAEYTFGKIYVKDKFRNEGSKQKVQSEQIKKTTTSIFSDSLKVIQTLPGVVTGDDFSSLMYVRGANFTKPPPL